MTAMPHTMIRLPPPQTEGGLPLMDAIRARQSSREFAERPLSPQLLSNLLWAAIGISHPERGGLTVPNARSRREVDVFAVTAEGTYLYNIESHGLKSVVAGDIRSLAGKQA